MNVYNYDRETFEFISATPAIESPLEPGVWLMPACATDTAPPETTAHQVAVFDNNQWQLKADWRGVELWSTKDGSTITVSEIGVDLGDIDATDLEPPSESCIWQEDHWEENEERKSQLLAKYKAHLCRWIDDNADNARSLLIGSPSQLAELEVIRQDAIRYNSKAYTGATPRSVQIWSDVKQCSLDEADEEIHSISAYRLDKGYEIMRLRLAGKNAVDNALSKEQAQTEADKAIKAIQSLNP